MSFREVRSFCEMMRALGYSRVVSMENFRSPNFQLVSELLYWLLKRYDPDTAIQDDISTIPERVRFLQETAQAMLTKARVKLNIKRLYAADGRAVKELLKIASLLYQASSTAGQDAEEMATETAEAMVALSTLDVHVTRATVGDITKAGSAIYEGLALEGGLKEARRAAIAAAADRADVDRTAAEAVAQLADEEERLQAALEELRGANAETGEKLKRKRAEFERMERRLAALKQVRPAYQKDLDELEAQLQGLYSQYLGRFRTLEYLQHELDIIHRRDQEAMQHEEHKLERMRTKIALAEMQLLRGQTAVREADLLAEFRDDDSDSDSAEGFTSPGEAAHFTRPQAAEGRGRAQGSIMAVRDDDEDDATDEDELMGEDSGDVETFITQRGRGAASKEFGMGGPRPGGFAAAGGDFDDGPEDDLDF